ncbi:MAG: diguanylate cyclase [Pseudomonadales bacterium]|nr:diguanylate cyclase [Pseudomonadales bacterium]
MPDNQQDYLIIFLSPEPSRTPGEQWQSDRYQQFAYFNDSLAAPADRPAVYVIDGKDPSYTKETLQQLRSHPDHYADLCFVSDPVGSSDDGLSDGKLPDPASLQGTVTESQQLNLLFKTIEDGQQTHEQWLMRFLLMRPNYVIKPLHQWSHARRYRYPILEVFGGPMIDTEGWLKRLVSQRILQSVELIDRQKECTFCKSAQLSFIDVCPNCSHIDINKQISLHCFTCGNVAAQDNFMNNGVLVCPNCSTRLRHIGADYDRPLENYRCNSCTHYFIEGDVLCRCAICEQTTSPAELLQNDIRSWKLSDHGRLTAMHGNSDDLFDVFNQLNYVPYELFIHDLNWLLIQANRYEATNFSVLGLYFTNIPELISEIGHQDVFQLLEGFSGHIRSLTRRTDLCARAVENTIWLLLPHTDYEGVKGLESRIKVAAQLTQQQEDHLLVCEMVHFSSSESSSVAEDAKLLLAQMQSDLIDAR